MNHPAVGRLRGRSLEGQTEALDRLHRLDGTWQVHWYPSLGQWVLAEHTGGDFTREVGKWRLERFEREKPQELRDDPSIAHSSELMMDGGVTLGFYAPDEIFTDRWWVEVEQMRDFSRREAPKLGGALKDQEWKQVKGEAMENKDYLAYCYERIEADPRLKEIFTDLNDEVKDAVPFYTGRLSAIGRGADFTEAR